MRFNTMIAALAATTLVAAPVAAAPSANPAQSLSVAGSRAGTPVTQGEQARGGLVVIVLAAAIIAGGIYLAIDGDDDDSDSN